MAPEERSEITDMEANEKKKKSHKKSRRRSKKKEGEDSDCYSQNSSNKDISFVLERRNKLNLSKGSIFGDRSSRSSNSLNGYHG